MPTKWIVSCRKNKTKQKRQTKKMYFPRSFFFFFFFAYLFSLCQNLSECKRKKIWNNDNNNRVIEALEKVLKIPRKKNSLFHGQFIEDCGGLCWWHRCSELRLDLSWTQSQYPLLNVPRNGTWDKLFQNGMNWKWNECTDSSYPASIIKKKPHQDDEKEEMKPPSLFSISLD